MCANADLYMSVWGRRSHDRAYVEHGPGAIPPPEPTSERKCEGQDSFAERVVAERPRGETSGA